MISAALVKELRDSTGAGIMECKKALEEVDGDLDAAVVILRKSGHAKAAKKEKRVAAEGIIAIKATPDSKTAIILEVNCETDFVSRGKSFLEFVDLVATLALQEKVANIELLSLMVLPDGQTVTTAREDLVAKIGENITIRRLKLLESETDGIIGNYLHNNGRIGALVSLSTASAELAKDIAMHVAAAKPFAVVPEELSLELISKEKEIYLAQLQDTKKPKEVLEKIVAGKVQKFISEITLVKQQFIKNPDQTIEELLIQSKALVYNFTRYEVGEGTDKIEKDFASEVQAQVAAQKH